jgi:hypothetical protein
MDNWGSTPTMVKEQIFLSFVTSSRLGALTLEAKRPGREADHSSPSSVEVKKAWGYTSTHSYSFVAWCLIKQWIRLLGIELTKHRDNFIF